MQALQAIQNEVLELVARGVPLCELAERLCRLVEAHDASVVCSVLAVDDERRLRPIAAPSLPGGFSASVDGVPIGPKAGSCGTAAFLGREVLVEDIATDPLWDGFAHLALDAGVAACWSRPVRGTDGRVLGTFALYYRECRGPAPAHRAIIERCTHLCSIAMEHDLLIARNRRLALADQLTGLPNRTAFEEDLGALAGRGPCATGLLLVDVDGLKIVNDTLGHAAGDALVASVASVLAELDGGIRAYRIGGDEFALLRPEAATPQSLRALASSIFRRLHALPQDATALGAPSVTIGAAIDKGTCELRRKADLALYHAKAERRGSYMMYKEGMRTAIGSRLEAIREVGTALADERMTTWLQPIVDLSDGRIVAMEALARMRREDGVVVSAGAFQAALDDAGIACAITDATLARVAATIREWDDAGIGAPTIGINVTAFDLARGGLDRRLARACERVGIAPSRIAVEITENAVMRAGDRAVTTTLAALKRRGVRVALDDFGTGFASLTHLLELPVDVIKIDRAFVSRMRTDPRARTIVEALLAISRGLSLNLIAEGIETMRQAEELRAMGCTLGQGFLFGRAEAPAIALELYRRLGRPTAAPARREASAA
ncbi:putative bifunctional diguanylate cyclase/phosphodiesterase [Salinarimonas rosea]|uniref:putative bifunctional diguanylate cyclase/phosphodiesterase n=1 Tax=Salinarimonas rosea TaxID=552063 RepID=UPI00040B35D5|nr:GGDEF domain-containing protein [Salinarimonas rosea]